MSKDIRIKKGLDIKLVGEAEQITAITNVSGVFVIKPENFHGITPKLTVKIGAEIKAGDSLFYSKSDERILFPSPISGKVTDIIRGERRKVLEIKILADATQQFVSFGKKEVQKCLEKK